MKLSDFIESELNKIEESNLLRELTTIDIPANLYVMIDSEKYLNLSSNNYLYYANNEEIKQSAIKAIKEYGTGSTGSRLITGTTPLHTKLEQELSKFKKTEAAMFLSCGFVANVSTIAAILKPEDVVFSDELNHASIIDGIKLSKANKYIYKHNNMADLETLLKAHREKYSKSLIISDTIFSMDGDRCDLKKLVELKNKYNSSLMVDEAHATGIIGKTGAGLAEHLNLSDKIDIQMGTLSKAMGIEGAYIAGSNNLIKYLRHKSRGFVFSTAPSPAIAGAAIKAIELISKDDKVREKLWKNCEYFKEKLIKLENDYQIKLIENNSPIFCFIVGDTKKTLNFKEHLFNKYKILASAIRPPTVKTSRIRICINSELSTGQLNYIVDSIKSTIIKI